MGSIVSRLCCSCCSKCRETRTRSGSSHCGSHAAGDNGLEMSVNLTRASSLNMPHPLPDLIGATEILTDQHRDNLNRHLPPRVQACPWTLIFSTSQNGFSLNSMYRRVYKLESPILIVVQDVDKYIFGALITCALRVSDHFFSTAESFLFTLTPEFKVFNSTTGENLNFTKGSNRSMSIGVADGKFGLWIDGDLNRGRSESCLIYDNDPLTPNMDFVVKTLECWAFISN